MKIAIEGLDGVGKTTVSKILSNKYGFMYIDKPLYKLFDFIDRSEVFDYFSKTESKIYNSSDFIIRSWLVGLGNIASIRQNINSNIILDRHLLSNYYWNGVDENFHVFKAIVETIGVPDITFVLYASANTRLSRIKNRYINDRDLFDPEMIDNDYKKMIEFAEQFHIPIQVINTENKMISDIIKEIENHLIFVQYTS